MVQPAPVPAHGRRRLNTGTKGQSGDSHGGFWEGVCKPTSGNGAGRAEHQGGKCRRNHCTVLPQLWALLASPMYRDDCQQHGLWLHRDRPPERGEAMSGGPHSTHHPPLQLGDEDSQSGEAEDVGTAGTGARGIPRGDGGRDGAAPAPHSLETPSSHRPPPPSPSRTLNGGHSSAYPPLLARAAWRRSRHGCQGAGLVALPGWEQDVALPWVQRAARGRDAVLFTQRPGELGAWLQALSPNVLAASAMSPCPGGAQTGVTCTQHPAPTTKAWIRPSSLLRIPRVLPPQQPQGPRSHTSPPGG